MTAYEQETISQIREISHLKDKVKSLEKEVENLREIINMLIRRMVRAEICLDYTIPAY